MRCSHCGKCCEETEMELSSRDIKRLEEANYRREEFTVTGKDGITQLRNIGRWCYFYNYAEKRCRAYEMRPIGCYLYPVVYSADEGVVIDELCPMGETVSEHELRMKGRILIKLLKMMENERVEQVARAISSLTKKRVVRNHNVFFLLLRECFSCGVCP